MKIGIEGQRLFRKKKHGMDVVALELINNLQEIDKKNEYVLFIKPDIDDQCIKETENFKIVKLKGRSFPIWEQYSLPKAARKEGCEILHCTSNTAPLKTKIPLVVTLHDIIYLEHISLLTKAGTWYQKFGNMYRRYVVPRIVKSSARIITVSKFEKNRIRNFFKLPESDNRLVAIYNGVGEHFKPVTDKVELKRIKEKYNLPDEFFFFFGNTDPKKNTKGVLEAFSKFISKSDRKIPLIMLDYDKNELNSILSDIGDKDLINHIQLTGYIVNTDLPVIYQLCTIFLYPSLRESFGIPMLEAMGCGTPVITSNTSSMPEVSGNAALIIDPHKPEEITEGIFKLLNDKKLCNELREKGFEQVKKFSWRTMAENVLKLYEEVYQETH